ncbi:MAG: hypothetical protein ACRDPR_21880 [Nocardioidaceae bacterium]
MHRLLSATAIGVSLLLAAPPSPASADASGFGFSDGAGVGAEAELESEEPADSPVRKRRSTPRPRCTYEAMPPENSEIADHMAKNGLGPSRTEGPGTWYWKICIGESGLTSGTSVWVPERPEPQAVARKALRDLRYSALADPAIDMSPPASHGAVVNVPLWLWVDTNAWAPTAATASVDGLTVTTTAKPDRVVWSIDNGDEIICAGPGTPYDPSRPEQEQQSDCTYLFSEAGTFVITATVEWRVTWTTRGSLGSGDLGVVRRSATVTVPVSEIQALNRPPQ